ncbi:MAG: hypothetical protein WD990_01380 [Acidimicrobiia bacterium]
MPVGSLLGGIVVAVTDVFTDRTVALRAPFWVAAAVFAAMLIYALPRLTTEQIETARSTPTG